MSLDLTEFEFTMDLTCEVGHHVEPPKAIRYMVMGCWNCRHTMPTTAICGDCYVRAMRHRTMTMSAGHLIICSACSKTSLPLQYVQFYDPKNLGLRVSP